MDINNPFETFKKSAFRLEALPQYLVEGEKAAFEAFKKTGTFPTFSDPEWSKLVKKNVSEGKSMKRLRLISDKLSQYEQFELQIYTGIKYGEDIRLNARHIYAREYSYDFWFFDETYISQIHYEQDGTFVSFDTRLATDKEKQMYEYWLEVFEESSRLS